MPNIKIDGKDYDTDDLSEETKAQLGSLQFVQAELGRLQAQAAALQTAQIAYGKALKETLETGKAPKEEEGAEIEGLGETIEFEE